MCCSLGRSRQAGCHTQGLLDKRESGGGGSCLASWSATGPDPAVTSGLSTICGSSVGCVLGARPGTCCLPAAAVTSARVLSAPGQDSSFLECGGQERGGGCLEKTSLN